MAKIQSLPIRPGQFDSVAVRRLVRPAQSAASAPTREAAALTSGPCIAYGGAEEPTEPPAEEQSEDPAARPVEEPTEERLAKEPLETALVDALFQERGDPRA